MKCSECSKKATSWTKRTPFCSKHSPFVRNARVKKVIPKYKKEKYGQPHSILTMDYFRNKLQSSSKEQDNQKINLEENTNGKTK
jgi:hypothetical protein